MMEPRTDPLLGSVIAGRYRLERRVASTDISVVYRAEDIRDRSVCAVKILHAARDEVAKRCLREAEAMAKVRNAHVVEALDHGILPSRNVFIAMEYLSGESLSTTLQRDGALPWPRAVRLIRQVAEAIAATHAQGIIHRDVKPGNCMRITRGEDSDFVKLLDFGISKNVDTRFPTLTSEGAVLGTPAYMAPELTATGKPEIASDVYSFGATLYQLLTGVLPFTGETLVDYYYHHSYTSLIPPSQRGAVELPEALEALVLRTMAKNPAERFQSMEAIVEVLDGLFPTAERPPPMDVQAREVDAEAIAHASESALGVETLTSAPPINVDDLETREHAAELTPAGIAIDATPGHPDLGDGAPMPFATTMTAATPGLPGSSSDHRGREAPLPMFGIVMRGLVLAAMFGLASVAWTAIEPSAEETLPAQPPADGVWVTAPAPLRPLPNRAALGLDGTPEPAADADADADAPPVDPGSKAVTAPDPVVAAETTPPAAEPTEPTEPTENTDRVEAPPPTVAPKPEITAFNGRAALKRSSRKKAALKRCAEKEDLVGIVKLLVHVGADGYVSNIDITSSKASASLKMCMLSAISGVRHPKSLDGGSFTMKIDLPAFLPMKGASN